jgi:hypothetical protein
MKDGKHGITVTPYVNGIKVKHWTLDQKAVASLDNKAGIQWDRLSNVGELFPPLNKRIDSPNFGIGHWQWGNNLGAIKRFGKFSTRADINFVGGTYLAQEGANNQLIEKIKDKLLLHSDLAGPNCGYTEYGLGRNMIYYLEAYDRFYLICDAAKKKNVTNRSYISPGTRTINSAIQYFWLGKPSNTYLRRRSMYGPYAYQWQVKRHNRDRNGNGFSEGFYSMGHAKKFSLMHDAPAVYGLYPKHSTNQYYLRRVQEVKTARDTLNIKYGYSFDPVNVRGTWFGEARSEGTARRYGSVFYSCDPMAGNYNQDICDYVSLAQGLASDINFSDYYCPPNLIAYGKCFDPCLSLRYSNGFFPGGKSLDLLGKNVSTNVNSDSHFI